MRVAALYDIHGNLPALEAAIDDIRAERTEGLPQVGIPALNWRNTLCRHTVPIQF